MKRFKAYAWAAAALLTLGMGSCNGTGDNPVPEGPKELFLTADKTMIQADGSDRVTFAVTYDGIAVGNSNDLRISYSYEGGEPVVMSAGTTLFSTRQSGSYLFTATLRVGEETVESNTVAITAAESEIEVKEYGRMVLGMQFTSTGCQNCPIMSTYMKELQMEFPNQLAVASFHTDYGGMRDPMSIQTTNSLLKRFDIQGLPHFALDMDPSLHCSANKAVISAMISSRLEEKPHSGVAISTEYNAAESKLTVQARIIATEAVKMRYIVLLVEDGIVATQMGLEGSEANNYVHNNVVRGLLTPNLNGEQLNNGKELIPGAEVIGMRAITIQPQWDIEKMRVIVASMYSEDGETFACDNVNECPAGQKVDYLEK